MENKQLNTTNKLGEELTFKIFRFEEQIKKVNPHKHNEYYELIFLSEGEGFHYIESEKYIMATPEFYILKPGQLHFWQTTSISKGFVILFKDSQFKGLIENDLINLYRLLSENTRIVIPKEKYPEYILNDILNEFNLNTKYSKRIIHGLLSVLLAKLLQLLEINPHESNLLISLFDKFQQLLTKECPRLHKVNDYANLLNTTPQNLNAICRKQVNRNASEMINYQLLLEAKRYILHTDNTINEITDILYFSDTSNFIKFFKKHEGLTPIQFREKYFH